MRLGVIADTHGLLRPEVLEVFAQVDHILHGGDVGKWDVVSELEALAPVTAVYGNVDGLEIRTRLARVATLRLDGFDIVVTHGDQFGSPTPAKLVAEFPRAEIIVFGHTHRPLIDWKGERLVFNPGGVHQWNRTTTAERLRQRPGWFEWSWLQVARHIRSSPEPSVGLLELGPDGVKPRIVAL